jgi:membrane peptidoglycan carboxypeptidase
VHLKRPDETETLIERPLTARRRLLSAALWLGLSLLAAAVATGLIAWLATPGVGDLQARVGALAAARSSTVLAPGDVPPLLAEALVATEDERFYQHHGIDVIGLGRAAVYDLTHGCLCQGGSTITQQLVKDVYLGGSDAGPSKVADMALALKVELRYSKAQILADYASIVGVGYGRYGMAGGACDYFAVPLAEVDLPQAALLAGMPQAPAAYDPLVHPADAAARRAHVLDAMVSEGDITAAQAAVADAAPLVVSSAPSPTCAMASPPGP